MEKIYIAFINYASCPLAFLEINAHLDQDELLRLGTLARESSRRAFLSGRVLARSVLGGLLRQEPTALRFCVAAGGKPTCHSHPGYSFSLSHSEGIAAIAVAKTSVGVDIESVRPNRQFAEIARTVFSKGEHEALMQGTTDSIYHFYTLWTLKEAWLKLHGLGIGDIGRCPDFHVDAQGKLVGVGAKNGDKAHLFSWHTQSLIGQKFVLSLATQRIQEGGGRPELTILSPFSGLVSPLDLQAASDFVEESAEQE